MAVEVEVRSFISEDDYLRLLEFMGRNARLIRDDEQVTYYLTGDGDLRLQKGKNSAKLWLKGGRIHDPHREETEVFFDRDDFEKMVELFGALGRTVKVKWFRQRKEFDWGGTTVMLDHTKGYGYIIEVEKMTQADDKEEIHRMLESKLKSLGVEITPHDEFERRFLHYVQNWKELCGE